MDRMIFLAMAGAKQVALAQASNTHNLANANTSGFRADLDAVASLPVHGPVHPSRVYASDELPEGSPLEEWVTRIDADESISKHVLENLPATAAEELVRYVVRHERTVRAIGPGVSV